VKRDDRIVRKMHITSAKYDLNRNQLILKGITDLDFNPVRAIKLACYQIATGEQEPGRLRELYDICQNKLIGDQQEVI